MADHAVTGRQSGKSPGERFDRLKDDRFVVVGVCIFLLIVIWLVFGQTLQHQFLNYDDDVYVYQNPYVIAGLTGRGILWAFTFAEIGHWHPVTWFSHMLDCRLWGLRAGGHHLTNVVLHACAAVLLFIAWKQMTGALWRSAFVAALFAIHPQRVESVAWIAERKDVLSAVFFMATILAYVRYVRKPASLVRYAVVVILFALGLMSKGMLITLPFVLLLLDYWPLQRLKPEIFESPGRSEHRAAILRLVGEKIPLFVLCAASGIATNLSPETIPPVLRMSFPLRMESAVVSYLIYAKQLFYPAGLSLPYFNPPGGFPLWQGMAAFALLIAISLGALFSRKTHPYFMVGWFWYLGMMLPVIGLVQISYYARADRYTYLPHIGLYLLITWSAAELLRPWRRGRAILTTAALLLITAFTMSAYAQAFYWHDSERLWRHVLATAPDNYVAHTNLGLVLNQNGQVDAAIAEYEAALRIQPAHARTHNNLGNALLGLGRTQEAIAHYEKALDIEPGFAQAHNNIGIALGQSGRVAEAITHFQKAIEISPAYANAHSNLGSAFLMNGNLNEARRELLRALEIRPDSAEDHKQLGDLLLKQGRASDAIIHYRKALQLQPNNAGLQRRLADALADTD
jgi:protein O-mannosyl-transferase